MKNIPKWKQEGLTYIRKRKRCYETLKAQNRIRFSKKEFYGFFSVIGEQKRNSLMTDWVDPYDLMDEFLNLYCVADDGVPARDVFRHYSVWCLDKGSEPLTHAKLGRGIIRVFGQVGKSGRDGDGQCCRMYHVRRKETVPVLEPEPEAKEQPSEG